ncbi:hypothetical protein HU125_22460 [Salmonella enterica subsp. enterica serovar Typhimurium]|nr:hypothetical protein [Salmonella enterica subsp. enterica serovar Typhimurium]
MMSRSSSFFGASAGGAGATLPVVSIPRPAGHGTGDFFLLLPGAVAIMRPALAF